MSENNSQSNPTVSLFMPSYNHSIYVRESLRSMFAQTYPNIIELTVIDDGSTDDSPKIIEETLKNCPFKCELIVRPNKGVCNTINEGIEKSCGEYFATTASDDIWLPNFVERRVKQLQNRPAAVLAYGHCYNIDENGFIINSSADWAEFDDGDAREMLLTRYPPLGQTIVFRKSALEVHKFNPHILADDFELYLRMSSIGEFAFEPSILSAYRIHSTNASRQTGKLIASKIKAFEINSEVLGLSQKETAEIIARVKWDSAEFLLASGQRFDAIKLALESRRAKVPVRKKLRQIGKLLLPNSIIKAGRRRIKKDSAASQGVNIKTLLSGGKTDFTR